MILWGLYKKMVIADNLAIYVDQVYGNVRAYTGGSVAAAVFFFSIQIYCDFSGYSDIARGSAKLLGIDLMENFRSPYFSASIREFWSRWHISLSTWFRDYVYIPLGGNRVSKGRNALNYLITFLLSGLWHGANLTFAAWGGLHGIGQICENTLDRKKGEKHNMIWAMRVLLVFIFVTLAWVFFRASTFHDALYVFTAMFSGITSVRSYLIDGAHALGIDKSLGLKLLIYLAPLILYDFISLKKDICEWIGSKKIMIRYVYMAVMILLILFAGYVGQSTFVYFQF